MTLTVLLASDDKRLATLDTVKIELNISNNDSDQMLNQMIRQATDAIESYTGRTFTKEQYREDLGANGRPILILEKTPIISIDAISFDGSTISSTTFVVQDPDAGLLFRERRWTRTWIWDSYITRTPSGHSREKYQIDYTAGYVTPCQSSTAGTRNLPYDLERAAIDIVTMSFETAGQNPNIAAQRTGDASESYFQAQGESIAGLSVQFPPSVRDTLARWRRNDP